MSNFYLSEALHISMIQGHFGKYLRGGKIYICAMASKCRKDSRENPGNTVRLDAKGINDYTRFS